MENAPDPVADLTDAYRQLRTRAASLLDAEPGSADVETVRRWLEDVHRFLLQDLLPFVSAEQLRLYPAVRRWTGVPASGFTRDHARMARLADRVFFARTQFDKPDTLAPRMRMALIGSVAGPLRQLVAAHLEREGPAVVAAIAEAQQRGEAQRIAAAMLRTARAAREAVHSV